MDKATLLTIGRTLEQNIERLQADGKEARINAFGLALLEATAKIAEENKNL